MNRRAIGRKSLWSAAEIRRQCEEIQRTWSPHQWAQRAGWVGDKFVPPHLRLLQTIVDVRERRERVA